MGGTRSRNGNKFGGIEENTRRQDEIRFGIHLWVAETQISAEGSEESKFHQSLIWDRFWSRRNCMFVLYLGEKKQVGLINLEK